VADTSAAALQRDIAIVCRNARTKAEILRAEAERLRQEMLWLGQARGAPAGVFVVSAMLGAVAAFRSYRSRRSRLPRPSSALSSD
jgi:hypothetical protein